MGRLRNPENWNSLWPKRVNRRTKNLLALATLTTATCHLGWLGTAVDASEPLQLAQTTPITYPTLSAGSTGESVSRLQATLKLLGFYQGDVDGNYSPTTQAAVSRFQSAAGIQIDGIAGPSTWRKLFPTPEDVSTVAATPETGTAPQEPTGETVSEPATPSVSSGPPILRPDAEGPAVAQLQRELQALGYYNGAIDGIYGEMTQSAVIAFQADQQIEGDAIVGPSTWDALTQALG